ncbi:uncharacterized protein VDAG_03594 [Verticillium dahliae VdLs.17]|uniref:C6 transcription factor n=1 Tax=Verticillium dahliae (strain VdLs.17 / ATCC MYA-4575 / FGSC 10137) TaxID=498257 RepID=G2X1I3_VERDV|nr:uncharacterized protein VDAG_03594 [Verticillium dahliae VdLs.17]EGY22156.1 hypothetical protein VDAG_03594 [Verticillium dahliae VdLs.17]
MPSSGSIFSLLNHHVSIDPRKSTITKKQHQQQPSITPIRPSQKAAPPIMVSTRSTTMSSPPSSPTKTTATKRSAANVASAWSHRPSNLTLAWLAISLPLVAWDTGYVMLRPHSMPGGAWHAPLWTPYELYGRIDGVYGIKAYEAGDGFTAAQAFLNIVETLMYLAYLWLCLRRGAPSPAEGPAGRRVVTGREGGSAVLIGFSAAVMTLSKTVLYWMKEYYSGFAYIGHNTAPDLIFLWIIPK